eukprot:TRINITY_DN2155_c0_g1_i1.p1 TRINITY_DN2155_c0_g1~~TRINITY_DN2155_c0_g1_i1.p1  ORF type:complete len:251 (+),score=50.45 TRINITY_DN2155_c0_g1_i1:66-755(+)
MSRALFQPHLFLAFLLGQCWCLCNDGVDGVKGGTIEQCEVDEAPRVSKEAPRAEEPASAVKSLVLLQLAAPSASLHAVLREDLSAAPSQAAVSPTGAIFLESGEKTASHAQARHMAKVLNGEFDGHGVAEATKVAAVTLHKSILKAAGRVALLDLQGIITLALFAVAMLAGLFLLWGGSFDSLRKDPVHNIQGVAHEVWEHPDAAYRRTQDRVEDDNMMIRSPVAEHTH